LSEATRRKKHNFCKNNQRSHRLSMYNHNPTFLTSFLCVTEAKAKNKRKKKKKKKQHNKFFTVLGDPVTVTILKCTPEHRQKNIIQ
jgi:hypothetical protein